MSNINFDLLDDLEISPQQLADTAEPKKSLPTTNLLEKIEESAPNPELSSSKDPEPATKENNIQILLDKQSEKLQLSNELNQLIKTRSSLRASIDETIERIEQLKASQLKKLVDDKLDRLLDESNEEYINSQRRTEKKHTESNLITPLSTRSATPIASSHTPNSVESLLSDLNVLPSNNWDNRLDNVKKFYPYLDIESVSTTNSYVDDETMVRTISFSVVCPLIFRVNVNVTIDPKSDSIVKIEIDQKQLTTLQLLSPSFYQVLTKNYIPNKKIDLVMYSLNSLSILIHKRVSLLFKLLKMFSSFVEDESLFKLTNTEDVSAAASNMKIFSNLKSVENIDFVIDKGSESYKLKLYWNIILDDVITGECQSSIKLLIIRQSDSKILNNVKNLFRELVKEYGLINGFCVLIKTTFGITVD